MSFIDHLPFINRIREKGMVDTINIRAAGIPLQQSHIDFPVPVPNRERVVPELASVMFESSPTIRACSDLIAGYGSTVPLKVYYQPSKTGKEREDTDNILSKIVRYINPRMTQSEYIAKLLYFLSLYDLAYVAIEENDNYDPKNPYSPRYCLYPMNPMWCRLVPFEDGSYEYRYAVNGNITYFPQDMVIRIETGFAPRDNFKSISKLNSAEFDVEQERVLRQFIARQYSDGVTLSGYIKTESTGDESLMTLQRQIETGYRGRDKAFRVLVLEKGMEYVPVQVGQFTNNTVGLSDQAAKTVRWLFGVPTPMFEADAKQMEIVEAFFWKRTIFPLLTRIEQAHDKYLAKFFDTSGKRSIRFDYSRVYALKRELIDLTKVAVANVNSGIMTVNEGRALLGMGMMEFNTNSYNDPKDWADGVIPLIMSQLEILSSGHGANDRGNAGSNGRSSPALSSTGSTSDRSSDMIDSTGKKEITSDDIQKLFDMELANFLDL